MPETMTASLGASVGGRSFSTNLSVTGDNRHPSSPTVGVAEAGTLTTRTDANTGIITMTSGGHTIATADIVDVYWTLLGVDYQRRHMTVGTVATTSVPIDGGAGDDLPATTTALTIKKEVKEGELALDGDDVVGIAMKAPSYRGQITIRQSDGTEILSKNLAAGAAFIWSDTSGETNPVAGSTIGNVTFTQAGTSASQEMVCDILYN